MGCFGSRLSSRRDFAKSNFGVVPYNFLTADELHPAGFSPIDKIDLSVTSNKDYSELYGEVKEFKLAEVKDSFKGQYESIKKAIEDLLKTIQDKYPAAQKKDGEVGGKYTGEEAVKQLKGVLTRLSKKEAIEGFTYPPAPEPPKEGEAPAEAAPSGEEAPLYSDEDLGDATGAVALPKVLLDCFLLYPFFADVVKAQVLINEFGDSAPQNFNHVAALVSAAVSASETEEVDVYFNSLLSGDDQKDLNDAIEKKQVLVFPGVIFGYADAETAASKTPKDLKGLTTVKFHIKAKAVKLAGGKVLAVHRLFARAGELKDGASELTEFSFAEVETYAKYLATVAAFKPAAKEAPKEEPKPVEEPKAEEPKPDEPKAEGS